VSGKSYTDLLQLSDTELSGFAYNCEIVKEPGLRRRYLDDHIDYYLNELNRTGVTRELLWKEYRQVEPEGYSYSQFCYLLSRHRNKKSPVYHNTYSPGELLEFDFAGEKMSYIDRSTGEVIECPVLVCTLPYSSFSYIEPLDSAKLVHLPAGHEPCLRILWRSCKDNTYR